MTGAIRQGRLIAVLALSIAACGGKSDSEHSLVGVGGHAGGRANSTGGTPPSADGGAQPSRGGAGGAIANTNAGGKLAVGGAASGGFSGVTTTGGTTAAGGIDAGGASLGGSAIGGEASGGSAGLGTSGGGQASGGTNAGGAGAANAGSTSAGTSSVAGAGLTDFCTGNESRVQFQGRSFPATATNYEGLSALSCCDALGVALHAHRELPFDLNVVVNRQIGSGTAAGTYSVGSSSLAVRASFNRSTDPISTAFGLAGTFRATEQSNSTLWEVGFCLAYNGTAADLIGTLLYVPKVPMMRYAWSNRFEIHLLADASITPGQASVVPLESLVLATTPWLDLRLITAVEATTHSIELTRGYIAGSTLRTTLTDVGMAGRPFVVTSEGVPIYLGTFFRSVSLLIPVGPVILVDDIAEDRFTIEAPLSGADPRFDPRIVTALTEAGKWVP